MKCIKKFFRKEIYEDVAVDTTIETTITNSFKTALDVVFEYEGIYSNDRYDSGGKTKFGIIEKEARRNGYHGKMKDMPKSFAEKIYKAKYWDALNLENIASIDYKVAVECFECGVNMGIRTSGKFLQRSLNAINDGKDLDIDGKLGSRTISKMQRLSQPRLESLVKMQNSLQGARYIALSENNSKLRKFMRGWFKRVY